MTTLNDVDFIECALVKMSARVRYSKALEIGQWMKKALTSLRGFDLVEGS